jgi:hypothetical protein
MTITRILIYVGTQFDFNRVLDSINKININTMIVYDVDDHCPKYTTIDLSNQISVYNMT